MGESEMEALFQEASDFGEKHCEVFDLSVQEHKHIYTELHQQFRQIFEDKLGGFLASIGRSPDAFYVALQTQLGKDKNDFGAQTMSELMWCCLDYEFFCNIMIEKKKEQMQKL